MEVKPFSLLLSRGKTATFLLCDCHLDSNICYDFSTSLDTFSPKMESLCIR